MKNPKDSVACPHRKCGGRMVVVDGSETPKMLQCNKCGEYYYRIGRSIRCVGSEEPRATRKADRLLEAAQGQPLLPGIAAKLQDQRRKMGLQDE